MMLADKIPLEAIHDHGVLAVPKSLSRDVALRLIKRGWAQWYQVDYTKRQRQPRGFVELTRAGKRAIQ